VLTYVHTHMQTTNPAVTLIRRYSVPCVRAESSLLIASGRANRAGKDNHLANLRRSDVRDGSYDGPVALRRAGHNGQTSALLNASRCDGLRYLWVSAQSEPPAGLSRTEQALQQASALTAAASCLLGWLWRCVATHYLCVGVGTPPSTIHPWSHPPWLPGSRAPWPAAGEVPAAPARLFVRRRRWISVFAPLSL